jgi:hypothetical protein
VNCKAVRTLRGARGEVGWVMSNTGHWLKLFRTSRRRCHGALRVGFCEDALFVVQGWCFEKCFEGTREGRRDRISRSH